jgi:excisionase family DNA binding protein
MMQAITQPPLVPSQSMLHSVLTLEEVAEYLRLPIDSVRRHAVQSLLPGQVIEGEWRFSRSAIDQWLAKPMPPVQNQPLISHEDLQAAKSRKDELLALVRSWDTSDQEAHQTETWNHLKTAFQQREGLPVKDEAG